MIDRRWTWRDTLFEVLVTPIVFVLISGGIILDLTKMAFRRDPWK